jgi:hypothetical protein
LYEREQGGSFRFVDVKPLTRVGSEGPRRVSAGDGVILRIPEYSNTARTTRAGTLYAHCTALNGNRRFDRVRFDCQGAMVFGDGQVVLAGVTSLSGNVNVAVTGGTGAYEGAHGQMTVNESQSTVTIHLLANH